MNKKSGEPSDDMPGQFDDFGLVPDSDMDDFFSDYQPTSRLPAVTDDEETAVIDPSSVEVTEAFWGGSVEPDAVSVSSGLTDDLPDSIEKVPDYDYLGHVEYEPEFEEDDDHIVGGYFGNPQVLEDINIPQQSTISSLKSSRRFRNSLVAASVVVVAASAASVFYFSKSDVKESATQESSIENESQSISASSDQAASPSISQTSDLLPGDSEETPESEQKAEEVLNVFPRMEKSVTAMKEEAEQTTSTAAKTTDANQVTTNRTPTTALTSSFSTTLAQVPQTVTVPPATTLPASPSTQPLATTLPQPPPTTAKPATTIATTVTTIQPTTTVPPTTVQPTTTVPPTTVQPTTTVPATTVAPTTTVEATTTTTAETCVIDEGQTTTTVENDDGLLSSLFDNISLPIPELACEDEDDDMVTTTVENQVETTNQDLQAVTTNQ